MSEAKLTDKTAAIHALARVMVAAIWIYHGLVPKLIFRDWSEMTLLSQMGLEVQMLPSVLQMAAFIEIGLGLLVLSAWRSRWPLWVTIGAMTGALLGVIQHSPKLLHAAFNPVSLNGAVIALAVIVLWTIPPEQSDQNAKPL